MSRATKKRVVFTGPPCSSCGKNLPGNEQIAEWLFKALDRAHEIAPRLRLVPDDEATDRDHAITVEALARASIVSHAWALKGLCGDCSYEKHSRGDDEFHIDAHNAWFDSFPDFKTDGVVVGKGKDGRIEYPCVARAPGLAVGLWKKGRSFVLLHVPTGRSLAWFEAREWAIEAMKKVARILPWAELRTVRQVSAALASGGKRTKSRLSKALALALPSGGSR